MDQYGMAMIGRRIRFLSVGQNWNEWDEKKVIKISNKKIVGENVILLGRKIQKRIFCWTLETRAENGKISHYPSRFINQSVCLTNLFFANVCYHLKQLYLLLFFFGKECSGFVTWQVICQIYFHSKKLPSGLFGSTGSPEKVDKRYALLLFIVIIVIIITRR